MKKTSPVSAAASPRQNEKTCGQLRTLKLAAVEAPSIHKFVVRKCGPRRRKFVWALARHTKERLDRYFSRAFEQARVVTGSHEQAHQVVARLKMIFRDQVVAMIHSLFRVLADPGLVQKAMRHRDVLGVLPADPLAALSATA